MATEKYTGIIPKWALKYFFLISITVFSIYYILWFRLFPFIFFDAYSSEDMLPVSNLLMGLGALKNYILFGALFSLLQNRKILRILALIPTVFYFGINYSIAISCFPSVIDTAKFEGASYYLTYNHPCILDTAYGRNFLTVYRGRQNSEVFDLLDDHGDKINYDGNTKIVSIVNVNSNETERLIFTLDDRPRVYEESEQYKEHLYYVNNECKSWTKKSYGYACETSTFRIYQCEMDNTSCTPLMQFTGKTYYNSYSYIEINETTGELEFYVVRDSRHTLVLSYDDYPHCHVEGCEILQP